MKSPSGIEVDLLAKKREMLRRREEALTESENRFSLFMDTLPAVAFIKDKIGTLVFANPYVEQVLGASGRRGKSVTTFSHR